MKYDRSKSVHPPCCSKRVNVFLDGVAGDSCDVTKGTISETHVDTPMLEGNVRHDDRWVHGHLF